MSGVIRIFTNAIDLESGLIDFRLHKTHTVAGEITKKIFDEPFEGVNLKALLADLMCFAKGKGSDYLFPSTG